MVTQVERLQQQRAQQLQSQRQINRRLQQAQLRRQQEQIKQQTSQPEQTQQIDTTQVQTEISQFNQNLTFENYEEKYSQLSEQAKALVQSPSELKQTKKFQEYKAQKEKQARINREIQEWEQAEKLYFKLRYGGGLRYDPKSRVGRKIRQLVKQNELAKASIDFAKKQQEQIKIKEKKTRLLEGKKEKSKKVFELPLEKPKGFDFPKKETIKDFDVKEFKTDQTIFPTGTSYFLEPTKFEFKRKPSPSGIGEGIPTKRITETKLKKAVAPKVGIVQITEASPEEVKEYKERLEEQSKDFLKEVEITKKEYRSSVPLPEDRFSFGELFKQKKYPSIVRKSYNFAGEKFLNVGGTITEKLGGEKPSESQTKKGGKIVGQSLLFTTFLQPFPTSGQIAKQVSDPAKVKILSRTTKLTGKKSVADITFKVRKSGTTRVGESTTISELRPTQRIGNVQKYMFVSGTKGSIAKQVLTPSLKTKLIKQKPFKIAQFGIGISSKKATVETSRAFIKQGKGITKAISIGTKRAIGGSKNIGIVGAKTKVISGKGEPSQTFGVDISVKNLGRAFFPASKKGALGVTAPKLVSPKPITTFKAIQPTQPSLSIFKTQIGSAFANLPIIATGTKSAIISAGGSLIKPKQNIEEAYRISQPQIFETQPITQTQPIIQTISPSSSQVQTPIPKQPQLIKQTQKTVPKPRTPTTPITPQTPKIRKPIIPRFKLDLPYKPNFGVNPNRGFDVYAKSQNKYRKITKKPVKFEDALNVGAYSTDNTLSAQFKIRPAKQKPSKPTIQTPPNYYRTRQNKFRPFKKIKGDRVPLKNQFIERKSYRLDTSGEVQKIQLNKWLSQKRKVNIQRVKRQQNINKLFSPNLRIF